MTRQRRLSSFLPQRRHICSRGRLFVAIRWELCRSVSCFMFPSQHVSSCIFWLFPVVETELKSLFKAEWWHQSSAIKLVLQPETLTESTWAKGPRLYTTGLMFMWGVRGTGLSRSSPPDKTKCQTGPDRISLRVRSKEAAPSKESESLRAEQASGSKPETRLPTGFRQKTGPKVQRSRSEPKGRGQNLVWEQH